MRFEKGRTPNIDKVCKILGLSKNVSDEVSNTERDKLDLIRRRDSELSESIESPIQTIKLVQPRETVMPSRIMQGDDLSRWTSTEDLVVTQTNMNGMTTIIKGFDLIDREKIGRHYPKGFHRDCMPMVRNSEQVQIKNISAETGTGCIAFNRVDADKINCKSSTGKIILNDVIAREVKIETGTGGAILKDVDGNCNVITSTNDIFISNVFGHIKSEASTGSFAILLDEIHSDVDIKSGTGDVFLCITDDSIAQPLFKRLLANGSNRRLQEVHEVINGHIINLNSGTGSIYLFNSKEKFIEFLRNNERMNEKYGARYGRDNRSRIEELQGCTKELYISLISGISLSLGQPQIN